MSDLPNNVVPISTHPKWTRRLHNQQVATKSGLNSSQTSTKGPASPTNRTLSTTHETEQAIGLVLRGITNALGDLHREGIEQRAILRALVGAVTDLKLLVDPLAIGVMK